MYVMNDKIYLRAETIESGLEVWVSDGSSSGTNMLKDIFPGIPPPSRMEPNFVALNGQTFFTTSDVIGTPHDYEVWVTDGTESGTQVLKDICTEKSTLTKNLVALSDRLLFTTENYALWITDGTTDGGRVEQIGEFEEVHEISSPQNDQVLLSVQNQSTGINKSELWVTDGLQKKPKKVMEMPPDADQVFS